MHRKFRGKSGRMVKETLTLWDETKNAWAEPKVSIVCQITPKK